MIVRSWHAWTLPSDADEYESLLMDEVFEEMKKRSIPGLSDLTLLRRDGDDEVEFHTLLWFDTPVHAREFAGDRGDAAVVDKRDLRLLTRYDPNIMVYSLRGSTADR